MIIAHIIWSMNCGGSENLLVNELSHFPAGHDLHLFVVNSGPNVLLPSVPNNAQVHCMGRVPGSGFMPSLVTCLKLTYAFYLIRPDVIVCQHPSLARFLPLVRCPKIARVHNAYIPIAAYTRSFEQIVAISSAVRENVKEQSPRTQPYVVYSGISSADFAQRTNWESHGRFRVLQLGRLDHEKKGQDITLRALQTCGERDGFHDWHLDFIGDGASRDMLVRLTKELGIENHVSFLGERPQSYIIEHLKDYHLLLQPSRSEGFGLTVAEAMAAKVPVLVSNIDGPAEIVDRGRYGFVFRDEDSDDCARAILEIVHMYRSNEIVEMVNAAHARVREHFDINGMVRNLERVYLKTKRESIEMK